MIATSLYGFEEYAVNGQNAWIVARAANDVAEAILDAFSDGAKRAAIAGAARIAAGRYGRGPFVEAWRLLFQELAPLASPCVCSDSPPDKQDA